MTFFHDSLFPQFILLHFVVIVYVVLLSDVVLITEVFFLFHTLSYRQRKYICVYFEIIFSRSVSQLLLLSVSPECTCVQCLTLSMIIIPLYSNFHNEFRVKTLSPAASKLRNVEGLKSTAHVHKFITTLFKSLYLLKRDYRSLRNPVVSILSFWDYHFPLVNKVKPPETEQRSAISGGCTYALY